jgi:hypothetical protein
VLLPLSHRRPGIDPLPVMQITVSRHWREYEPKIIQSDQKAAFSNYDRGLGLVLPHLLPPHRWLDPTEQVSNGVHGAPAGFIPRAFGQHQTEGNRQAHGRPIPSHRAGGIIQHIVVGSDLIAVHSATARHNSQSLAAVLKNVHLTSLRPELRHDSSL